MWQVYYAHGGVQAIAELRDGRTLLHSMGDFYIFDGQGWKTSNKGPNSWPSNYVVLEGKEINSKEFKAIRDEAMKWLHEQVC